MSAHQDMGRMFTANDLEKASRERIKARLEELRPDLFETGVEVLIAKRDSEVAVEKLRTELHKTLGSDGVEYALGMLADIAKTAPQKPKAPIIGTEDGVSIVGQQIDQMKKTHVAKSVTTRSLDDQSKNR